MPFQDQVHFGARVGPPEIDARFRGGVMKMTVDFEKQELFEKPSGQTRIRRCGQAAIDGIGHTGIEKVEPGMRHQTFARAFHPRQEAIADERVLQDFIVRLHGPDGQPASRHCERSEATPGFEC